MSLKHNSLHPLGVTVQCVHLGTERTSEQTQIRHTGDLGRAGGSSEGEVRRGQVLIYSEREVAKCANGEGVRGESNHGSKIRCSVRTTELPFTEMRKNMGESKF